MLPSWIRSRNCRPRLVYFLAMEMTRRRFASTISFLAWRASRSPFCTMCTILRNSPISTPVCGGEVVHQRADFLDAVLLLGDQVLPALGGEFRDAVEPARVELAAHVLLEEVLARDAVALGQPHQPALVGDQPLVDVVELLDQRIDARLVQPQRLHLGDDLFLQLLVFALLRRRQRGRAQAELDVLLLQAAQALEAVGDVVEGLDHFGLELGFDGGERERTLHVVVFVVIALGGGLGRILRPRLVAVAVGLGLERRGGGGRGRRRLRLLHDLQMRRAGHRRAAAAARSACRRGRSPPAAASSWRRGRHRSLPGR